MPRASKATKGILGRTLMKVVDKKNHNYKPKTVDEPKFIHPENNQIIDNQQKDL